MTDTEEPERAVLQGGQQLTRRSHESAEAFNSRVARERARLAEREHRRQDADGEPPLEKFRRVWDR